MDYWFLMIAAAISLLGMVIHGVPGARIYMGNIMNSDMMPLTKSLSLVAWHAFTIFLFVSGVALIYIAYNPADGIAAYPIIGVNALGAALFVFLGLGKHGHLLKMPGAYLMGSTALFAYLGVF